MQIAQKVANADLVLGRVFFCWFQTDKDSWRYVPVVLREHRRTTGRNRSKIKCSSLMEDPSEKFMFKVDPDLAEDQAENKMLFSCPGQSFEKVQQRPGGEDKWKLCFH